QGNRIGTDITGTHALANGSNGVELNGSHVIVGGTAPGAGNVISGNLGNGVLILASPFFSILASDNLVEGNFIGTNATGTSPVGNGMDGIGIFGNFFGATNNSIGGTSLGAGNIIAFNGHNGVTIGAFAFDPSTVEDSILSNSIFANGALGIDLADDGVTL